MARITQSKPVSKEQRSASNVPATRRAKMDDRAIATKLSASRKPGKIHKVVAMMRRPKGATIAELAKLTDWQTHSVRGAISGTIKKKRGLKIVSEKAGGVRTYRIAG